MTQDFEHIAPPAQEPSIRSRHHVSIERRQHLVPGSSRFWQHLRHALPSSDPVPDLHFIEHRA
jgi:hypothetical protein